MAAWCSKRSSCFHSCFHLRVAVVVGDADVDVVEGIITDSQTWICLNGVKTAKCNRIGTKVCF